MIFYRIRIVGLIILLWSNAAVLLWSCGTCNADDRPDILFIAVDDLNDWTGHLRGHPQARTPNIDRLVARGLLFTNAHCAAPACNPSRTALMSGVRPWRSGIYLNPHHAAGFLKNTVTINRHFLAAGYRVMGGGKIYHGYESEGRDDTWTQWKSNLKGKSLSNQNFNGLGRKHFDWGPIPVKTSEMRDARLTDWAIERLKKTPTDRPLFLAVGYVKPHLPWYVPEEYFDRFPLDKIRLPEVTGTDLDDIPAAGRKMAKPQGDHAAVIKGKQWKKAVQGYLATISFLDDQVGRLLKALEESPRARKTIVVWWTDHGWHLGEKQHWRKFALWNDATHTSFAIAVPGMTRPDSRCDQPVDYTSVFPTLCELAGLKTPEHAIGPSLVPLLKNEKTAWPHVAICTHGRGNHAVISRTHRLIRYADGSLELYNRQKDPNEWNNLALDAGSKPVISELQKFLPLLKEEVAPQGTTGRSGDPSGKR